MVIRWKHLLPGFLSGAGSLTRLAGKCGDGAARGSAASSLSFYCRQEEEEEEEERRRSGADAAADTWRSALELRRPRSPSSPVTRARPLLDQLRAAEDSRRPGFLKSLFYLQDDARHRQKRPQRR